DQRQIRVRMVEDDMARRVAGTVPNVERELADSDLIAVDQPARRLERAADHSVARTVLAEPLDPETVVLVRALDRDAELLREDSGAAAMVDMAVGEQDLLDRHAGLLRSRLEPREVAAGIDEGA